MHIKTANNPKLRYFDAKGDLLEQLNGYAALLGAPHEKGFFGRRQARGATRGVRQRGDKADEHGVVRVVLAAEAVCAIAERVSGLQHASGSTAATAESEGCCGTVSALRGGGAQQKSRSSFDLFE